MGLPCNPLNKFRWFFVNGMASYRKFRSFRNFVILATFRNFWWAFPATLWINFVDFVNGMANYRKCRSLRSCVLSWTLLEFPSKQELFSQFVTCCFAYCVYTLMWDKAFFYRRQALGFYWPWEISSRFCIQLSDRCFSWFPTAMLVSINLGRKFFRISCIRKIAATWILARVCIFTFFPFQDSGLYLLRGFDIFILIYFEWRDSNCWHTSVINILNLFILIMTWRFVCTLHTFSKVTVEI